MDADELVEATPVVSMIDGETGSQSQSPLVVRVRSANETSSPPPSLVRKTTNPTNQNPWRALRQAYASRAIGAFRARPGDGDAVAWTGDKFPGAVDAVEIHFVYPFSIGSRSDGAGVDESLVDVQTEVDGVDDTNAFLFGDDGHLRFKELIKTIEINSVEIDTNQFQRLTSTSDGSDVTGGNGHIPMIDRRSSPLPLSLKDKHGNVYNLNQVFVRLFSFNVGVLRFAIMSQGRVDVQAVLDVQNAVMRLDDPKQAGRLIYTKDDVEVGSFLPRNFIRGILNKRFQNWKADEGTDRLFTFTLAGISQLRDEKEIKMAAYNIGQMEWDAAAAVDEAYVDEFRDNNVYTRFASPTGGLWSCFHPDGGCILFFMEKSSELPIWGYSRREKKKVSLFGSSRVLVAFSLIEPLVFQRMYLRGLDQTLSSIIMSDRHDRRNLAMLKKVHGELLRFRAKFSSTPLSTTTAGKQQFHLWAGVVGLHEMTSNLLETVKDLHEYYNDIEEKASQQRLDMLAIILGFLGIAQLVSDIFWAYRNERDPSDKRDALNAVVPSSLAGLLLVVAVIFIVVTRRKVRVE